MAKKKKVTTPEEESKIYESPEVLQEQIEKTQEFAEKNRNLIAGVLTVLVLIIGGFFWYRWYNSQQNQKAQAQLFPAEFYFQKDSLNKALYGDGNNTDGLLAIADDYGSTKAGNLAKFYIGTIYLKQGEYQQAIEYLESFSSDDYLIQARAYALIGDAYVELEDFPEAISAFGKAADYRPNEQFTPSYLMKLALAYEANGDKEAAIETYQTIIDEYKNSTEVRNAKKYLSSLKAAG